MASVRYDDTEPEPYATKRATGWTSDVVILRNLSPCQLEHRCFEAFLMQNIPFGVEVLIHVDASLDGTQEIVAEYVLRYPGVFRTALQNENQFLQAVTVEILLRAQATRKYPTHCEGGDCWIDPQKLVKQVNYMKAHAGGVTTTYVTNLLNAANGQAQVKHNPTPEERSLSAVRLHMPRNCTRRFRSIDIPVPPEKNEASPVSSCNHA